jgi:hypothetical protein
MFKINQMKRTTTKILCVLKNKNSKLKMLNKKAARFKLLNSNFLKSIVVLLVLVVGYSCASHKGVSYAEKDVDFTQFKSLVYFGWSKGSGSLINDSERTQIEKAFGAEFRNRDIEIRTLADQYDLVVSLFLILDKTTSVTAYNSHYQGGIYNGVSSYGSGFGFGYSPTIYREHDHVKGTLIVDVIDAKTKQKIWQGIGKGFVDPNPATREKNIPGAVKSIMSSYPVKRKK